jgi:tetratricopeptide (TPR) repeat protein
MEQHLAKVLESLDRRLSPREKTAIAKENEKLRLARISLQRYQVEQVYYQLALDPIQGFVTYYEYAEEAFRNNEPGMLLPLRDEMLKFAKQSQRAGEAEPGGLALTIIESDMGTRWIKQNIALGRYDLARKQIRNFRDSCPELINSGSFTDMDLKIWEGWALVNQGSDLEKAETLLHEVLLGTNKTSSNPDSFEKKRSLRLQAYAYYTLGYLYRCQGRFILAIEQYKKALPIWRDLKDKSEQSIVLNALSYAEAEYGFFEDAEEHCKDGLKLRKELGRRYTIALSLNTLGVIETKNDNPGQARYRCEQALNIFRELEQPRGVALACHALAESLRRMTGIADLISKDDALKQLDRAEKLADEAVDIFTKQVHETLRLAEANIELGCVCREKARRLVPVKGKSMALIAEKREAAAKKSELALRAAYVAAKDEFAYRAIDALVNLAWLQYYMNKPDIAKRTLLEEVLPLIDPKYLLARSGWTEDIKDAEPWIWVQIGKSNLLLGLIEFDKYKSSHREKDDNAAEIHLRKAAHDWALSLAYDARFSPNFRDLKRARDLIYQNIAVLNSQEMSWARASIQQTHEEYKIPERLQLFDKFLRERFGELIVDQG